MDIYDMVLTAEFDLITSIESVEDINRLVEWNYDLTKYEFFLLNTDDVEIFDRLIEIGCDATSINDGYTLLESTKNIKITKRTNVQTEKQQCEQYIYIYIVNIVI